ncbi:DUF2721 domain-containing protein [Erythrobacter sp. W53]|uniref:DUF2721 domain-containing protein n=1 Tax=Erythrobacter sp. W53 TaxID=3425947 RepID=UPI003D768F79
MGEVIQLVVAPAFLLVAIAALLGVVTGRLGRVIDRARELENKVAVEVDSETKSRTLDELRNLDRRIRLNHWSINFFCVAALIVAVMVATLFFAYLGDRIPPDAIAVLFISAMAGIMIGILFFIAEVYLATKTVRVHFELF